MLSEKQMMDAITFVQTYKDALNCVEQVAENRENYNYYENTTKMLVEAIKEKQIHMDKH